VSQSVFFYGTLRDPALLALVAGREVSARPASLPGFRTARVEGHDFPTLVADDDATANGLLAEVDARAQERLDFYELGFGYDLRPVSVRTEKGAAVALVYFPEPGLWKPDGAWSLEGWQADGAPLARAAAGEYMRLHGVMDPASAARAFDQIRMRAGARLRAAEAPTPAPLPPAMSAKDVRIAETRQPYTAYFAVREDVLTFPRFSGGHSAPVLRSSFQGGDAVTVVPYDPGTDRLLVVRQFRHGPFTRGDANPWTLEPAAGRIDAGETPEQTARRELLEETGIEAGTLHLISRYYPSPGAFNEYLWSYVAIADLSAQDGRIAGLEGENEDILSHVLGFDEAMAMVETGAANTAPLVLTLFWLAANRDRLRG